MIFHYLPEGSASTWLAASSWASAFPLAGVVLSSPASTAAALPGAAGTASLGYSSTNVVSQNTLTLRGNRSAISGRHTAAGKKW